jgi:hypothetical protein
MKTLLIPAILSASFLPAAAQESFTIPWSVITGGGSAGSGPGEFTVSAASIGQFAAGDPDNEVAGEFAVTGGVWAFEYQPPPNLNLTMQLDGGMVTLTWQATVTPVVLESSENLDLWAPVNPQPAVPFFQEPEGARKFYRLTPGP